MEARAAVEVAAHAARRRLPPNPENDPIAEELRAKTGELMKLYRTIRERARGVDAATLVHCTRFLNVKRDLDEDARRCEGDDDATLSIAYSKAMRACLSLIEANCKGDAARTTRMVDYFCALGVQMDVSEAPNQSAPSSELVTASAVVSGTPKVVRVSEGEMPRRAQAAEACAFLGRMCTWSNDEDPAAAGTDDGSWRVEAVGTRDVTLFSDTLGCVAVPLPDFLAKVREHHVAFEDD